MASSKRVLVHFGYAVLEEEGRNWMLPVGRETYANGSVGCCHDEHFFVLKCKAEDSTRGGGCIVAAGFKSNAVARDRQNLLMQ
jgi:hypothetical protein